MMRKEYKMLHKDSQKLALLHFTFWKTVCYHLNKISHYIQAVEKLEGDNFAAMQIMRYELLKTVGNYAYFSEVLRHLLKY